jgi:phosphoglycolate phosphatase-like HAD superfamily hydrolase
MKPAVIFDIDGTITDLSHREYLVRQKKPDYGLFYSLAKYDQPVMPMVNLGMTLASSGFALLFVTGRPYKIQGDTKDWLSRYFNMSEQNLFMRGDEDHRHDATIKHEIYKQLIEPTYKVELVFEDRNRCVEMWRNLGLVCLQPRPGDF